MQGRIYFLLGVKNVSTKCIFANYLYQKSQKNPEVLFEIPLYSYNKMRPS